MITFSSEKTKGKDDFGSYQGYDKPRSITTNDKEQVVNPSVVVTSNGYFSNSKDGSEEKIGPEHISADRCQFSLQVEWFLWTEKKIAGDEIENYDGIGYIDIIGNSHVRVAFIVDFSMESQNGHHAESSHQVNPFNPVHTHFFRDEINSDDSMMIKGMKGWWKRASP
jgi:hypothetical protein